MESLTKKCTISGKEFEISKKDQEFYNQLKVPTPTLHPDERKRRRLAHGNMQHLYRRKCDQTGQKIVSIYSSDKPFPIYHNKYWWSDQFDASQYGRNFDFNRPFFEQFSELQKVVPKPHLITSYGTSENSDYINYASYLKNCYLVFHTAFCEECLYCIGLRRCKDTLDCHYVYDSQLCYECTNCNNCYDLKYSKDCRGCSSSWFLRDCVNCSDCFGCCNLINKSYCIFNEQKTKEEYEEFIQNFQSQDRKILNETWKKAQEFHLKFPVRATHGAQNESSTGDYLYECKNVHESFHILKAEDCKFCDRVYDNCKNFYDVDQFGHNSELLYECECCGFDSYNIRFCLKVRDGSVNVLYSDHCFSTKDSFGCIGLKKKQFCILNQQYSKEEYEELLPKIIDHLKSTREWGEFFPIEISPFSYNESIAQDYFPLSKEEVLSRGWKWKEKDDEPKKGNANVSICKNTGRPFQLTSKELSFYEKMKLPTPEYHPDERNKQRYLRDNPSKLFNRTCAKTGILIKTSYPPNSPEIVYSEESYLSEIY